MEKLGYKYGVRIEPYTKSAFIGLGLTWFTEKVLQIDLLFWSISIGQVYDIEED